MKAEGAWEQDGKSAVSTWEKGEKAKKGGLAGSTAVFRKIERM
jgi:hypothetical protein